MRTLRLHAHDPQHIFRAAEILRRGGLVAFPTETVYGLGANAFSAPAVCEIFRAKDRPAWDPLIVHVPTRNELATVAQVQGSCAARVWELTVRYWPGPLTLLLPRTPAIPDEVTAGRDLVGVRVPAHPVAQALLRAARVPVAAPSANRFGHVSPTTAEHVLADLDGRIDAVLDGGPCEVGVESTVLDPETTPITIYRAGAVTVRGVTETCGVPARLFEALDRVAEDPSALPSPGVGLRHYAPGTPLRLCEGTASALAESVQSLRIDHRVGVLLPGDWTLPEARGVIVQPWGRWEQVETLAAGLFRCLRALEGSEATVLVCPMPAPGGLGDALRDRLTKAAK